MHFTIVVVSEETGSISVTFDGKLRRDISQLRVFEELLAEHWFGFLLKERCENKMLESKYGLRFILYYWQSFSIYQLIMYLEIFLVMIIYHKIHLKQLKMYLLR